MSTEHITYPNEITESTSKRMFMCVCGRERYYSSFELTTLLERRYAMVAGSTPSLLNAVSIELTAVDEIVQGKML